MVRTAAQPQPKGGARRRSRVGRRLPIFSGDGANVIIATVSQPSVREGKRAPVQAREAAKKTLVKIPSLRQRRRLFFAGTIHFGRRTAGP
jgi:hypothetical protein